MASYNGTVILSGMISPTDTTDAYPTHEDILGKGGYSSVADVTARDAISTLRRKNGMMVYVETDGKTYQLQGGTDNSNWVEFTSGTSEATQNTLNVTDISVTGIINTIFAGITIPEDEILYVRGNGGEIDTEVFSGVLSTVLDNNTYNDFIIKFDGTSSVVYIKNTVEQIHVQNIINGYPIGYDSIDLTNNTISAKISTILTETYTDSIQVFAYEGLMASVEHENNTFTALNKNKEFVVLYDGSTFSAYKKQKVTISDLQNRMVLS
jgi:hypothetical protein